MKTMLNISPVSDDGIYDRFLAMREADQQKKEQKLLLELLESEEEEVRTRYNSSITQINDNE